VSKKIRKPNPTYVKKEHTDKSYQIPNNRSQVTGVAQDVVCKCTICEKLYVRHMYWRGNGMPRKMCMECILTLDNRQARSNKRMSKRVSGIRRRR